MLGNLLRTSRESAGLTQEALAYRAGVDRSYISQLERGLKSPTVKMFLRICRALEISPSKIIAQIENAPVTKKRT
jgi:transcriptional regulator with XRE-family HTH domain